MEVKTFSSLRDCSTIWNAFTPDRRLFDSWDYRLFFFDKKAGKPNFMVGKQDGNVVGVIPLSYQKGKGSYTYFGDWFPERNSFFMTDKTKLSQLLSKCPQNTIMEGIDPEEIKYYDFSEDEYTYFIDLAKYKYSFEKYFDSFDKKKRKNFQRELKNIPKYRIVHNRLKDFKRLVELNLRQFDTESIYSSKNLRQGMWKLINHAHKKGQLQMLSVEINKKVEAVDVGLKYKEWYHVITGSSNNEKIPNLGKLMTVLNVQNAIKKKARYVDFLASSSYWKNQWGFDREMLFKFEK